MNNFTKTSGANVRKFDRECPDLDSGANVTLPGSVQYFEIFKGYRKILEREVQKTTIPSQRKATV